MIKLALLGVSAVGGTVCYFHGPQICAHLTALAAQFF
jgi:hypothetical protein